MNIKKVPTSREVYMAIYSAHSEHLNVYSSYSATEGSMQSDCCEMMTEWCIEGSDLPIIGYRRSWVNGEDVNEFEYWLFSFANG